MDPALAHKPEHRRAFGHVIADLAGELGAEAVDGEFGFAAGGDVAVSRVAQLPVCDLVLGEQGEFVRGQPGGRAAGEGVAVKSLVSAHFPTPPKSDNWTGFPSR